MKTIAIVSGLIWTATLSQVVYGVEQSRLLSDAPASVERFGMDSDRCILAQEHLWVFGGGLTVNPNLSDVAGIRNVVSPPWTTSGFELGFSFDDKAVAPQGYRWLPGEFRRWASLDKETRVETLLWPLASNRGFVMAVCMANSGQRPRRVRLGMKAGGRFGKPAEYQWTFGPSTRDGLLNESNKCEFKLSDKGWVIADSQVGSIFVVTDLEDVRGEDGQMNGDIVVEAGATRQFHVVMTLGEAKQAKQLAEEAIADPVRQLRESRKRLESLIEEIYQRLPRLTCSDKRLVDWYDRSLLTYVMSRWELREFVAHPYYPTCGLDGGAMNFYVWDYGYAPKTHSLHHPATIRENIRLLLKAKLFHNYSFLPFNGKPSGAWYAYNHVSIIKLIYNYVLVTGDKSFLSEEVAGKTVLNWAYEHAVNLDPQDQPVDLVNYGRNKNLLELRKTENYQYYVPSPNAERCWSYRAVDEMAEWAGQKPFGLRLRGEQLKEVIRDKLWSPKDRWFCSLDTKGNKRLCYSIQIFDMLRFDILNEEQKQGIVTHLNDKEFLSEWGPHSLSKTDSGYDPLDVDWGGPGTYIGDAPQLVQDLLHVGYDKQADDVLQRTLWWGRHLPYYPQAVRADRIDYRRNGRANEIGAVAAADSVLFGLLGLRVEMNGDVIICPHLPSFVERMEFSGVRARGQCFDVRIAKGEYRVTVDGSEVARSELGHPTRLLRP